jgi:hypothetical protein
MRRAAMIIASTNDLQFCDLLDLLDSGALSCIDRCRPVCRVTSFLACVVDYAAILLPLTVD